MKTNELRLGNYINFNGDIRKIIGISDNMFGLDVNNSFVDAFEHEGVEPIPLTEEWLLRIEKIPWLSKDIGGYFVWFNGDKIYIGFVHTLQNFYFALKNEELILKQI